MDLAMFNQIAQITDHLYLSSAGAIKSERIRSLGITNIINCTMEIPNLKLPNLECIQIHVEDSPNARLGTYFDRCADKIQTVHKSGGKTLVHCVAGVSRSASLVMAYLMKYQRMPLDLAYYHIKRRPVIHPNVGFWRQMIDFERRIFGRNTVQMIPSGIGPIPDVYKEETKNMVRIPNRPQPQSRPQFSRNIAPPITGLITLAPYRPGIETGVGQSMLYILHVGNKVSLSELGSKITVNEGLYDPRSVKLGLNACA